jgi:hypothetical protein
MTEAQNIIYTFFAQQGFFPINKGAYPLFKEYEGNIRLFEMTAVLNVIWAFASGGIYKVISGYLCSVWFFDRGIYFCLQASNETKYPLKGIIDRLYDLSLAAGLSCLSINFIDERFIDKYKSVEGYAIQTEQDDDWNEYAYPVRNILELSGTENYYKRKRVKRYMDKPGISIIPLTKENFDLCFKVEETWCREQDCAYCASFSGCAKESLENMAALFDNRLHRGILGYIDNVPAGYVVWEEISKTAFVYFAKSFVADFTIYLYYAVARDYLPDTKAEYINNGSDMGKPGLRQFKKNLSAHELWKKYICTYTRRTAL